VFSLGNESSDDETTRVEFTRIAELLKPFLGPSHQGLSHAQLKQVSDYLDLLRRWNQKIGLTSVREPEHIVTRHFGESFFAAAHLLEPGSHGSVIDIGSGAGFPGLPLKIYAPESSLTLIESNQKKAAFLKEAIRTMRLRNATVFAGRAEDCNEHGNVVTLRAVEKFDSVLPVTSKLVNAGGHLALLIGSAQVEATKSILGEWRWEPPMLIPQSSQRLLLIGTNPER
jgi:16S rRNA (guanine527-N7)-methyltransferase